MNRFERLFGILFVVALVFKFFHWPGGGILATVSLTSLACLYYLFGFAIFNNIELNDIFNRKSYEGISALRIIGSIGVGWGLSTICMGILFKIQHWPGANIMLLSGFITIIVVFIIALVKFFLSKSDFYKTVLLRIAIIGGFGLIFFFTTDLGLTVAKIQYRNHPDYIKAYELYLENLESQKAYHNWKIEHIRATSKSHEEFEARKKEYETEIRMLEEYKKNKQENQ